jgi:hypothetical protein
MPVDNWRFNSLRFDWWRRGGVGAQTDKVSITVEGNRRNTQGLNTFMPYKNIEDRRAYKKAYRLRIRLDKNTNINCLNCGEPLPPRRLKYCSDNCAYVYTKKYLRIPERVREIKRNSKKRCGVKFVEKIRKRISGRLKGLLSGNRHVINYRNGVISYTENELRSHLEKRFKEGMSWSNYGTTWHIDHKIPITAFNLSCDEDIKRCWSLGNLQPLFALENIKKSNRLERPSQPLLI